MLMVTLLKRVEIRNLSDKELLLLTLYNLSKRNYREIDESQLHQLVFILREVLPFRYRFLTKPVIFSYDLSSDMRDVRSDGYVNILIEVIDESVPRYSYELSLPGRARAEKIFDSLSENEKGKLERATEKAISMLTKLLY